MAMRPDTKCIFPQQSSYFFNRMVHRLKKLPFVRHFIDAYRYNGRVGAQHAAPMKAVSLSRQMTHLNTQSQSRNNPFFPPFTAAENLLANSTVY
jgi:hypothetical protein